MRDKIKIFCHSCEGKKFVFENKYPNNESVAVPCPECGGKGYVHDELWEE